MIRLNYDHGVPLFGCNTGYKEYDYLYLFPDGTARGMHASGSSFDDTRLETNDLKREAFFDFSGNWVQTGNEIRIALECYDGSTKIYKGIIIDPYTLKLDVTSSGFHPKHWFRDFQGKPFYTLGWLIDGRFLWNNELPLEIRKGTSAGGKKKGCYIATCIYGSYDCPEVWTLRRFRDNKLEQSLFGRAFIRTYYAISPSIVRLFGNIHWIRILWKCVIDKFIIKLQNKGVESSPYYDE